MENKLYKLIKSMALIFLLITSNMGYCADSKIKIESVSDLYSLLYKGVSNKSPSKENEYSLGELEKRRLLIDYEYESLHRKTRNLALREGRR